MNHEYWVKKFLFPFSLDPAPLKLSDYPIHGPAQGSISAQQPTKKPRPGDKIDILNTDQFNYPVSHIDHKKEYLQDIINPLTVQKDQIVTDMYMYSREFPQKIIPHITEIGEINDNIHNYKRPKIKEQIKPVTKKEEMLKQ